MKLFKCCNYEMIELDELGRIETPLGSIILDLEIQNESISSIKPSGIYKLSNGGYIIEWITNNCTVELLLCRPLLTIPLHMSVDDCWAGLWRIQSYSNIDKCCFIARWEKGYTWTDGGVNSGEHLECQIWENSKTSVAIGTEDGECLISRAYENNYFPKRLESEIERYKAVKYFNEGLLVPIPNLLHRETCQVQFVIAWADSYLPTWYAVDMTADEILQAEMCN